MPNILAAPECPPGLPSLPSPFSGKVHGWRVIDFEQGLKTDLDVRTIALNYSSHLMDVYDEVEEVCEEEVFSDSDDEIWDHTGSDESSPDDEA